MLFADMPLTFLVTTVLFAFIPGPAMLYAAARIVAGGRWSGIMAALGIHLGGYVHVATAAAGLSVLFSVVPALYLAVKFAGAGYLVWLGVAMIRAKPDGDVAVPAVKFGRRAFLESVSVEVLNPKTALFFVAFLPQFVDGAQGLPMWLRFGLLETFVNCMFSLTDLLCVFLAATITSRLRRSPGAQRLMQRVGGSVLVGLGAHVALQQT